MGGVSGVGEEVEERSELFPKRKWRATTLYGKMTFRYKNRFISKIIFRHHKMWLAIRRTARGCFAVTTPSQ